MSGTTPWAKGQVKKTLFWDTGYETGNKGIPIPVCWLSLRVAPEWNRVWPISRTLVAELKLCVEVSPTIFSWYFSASHTNLGSSPNRKIAFHVPTASAAGDLTTRPRHTWSKHSVSVVTGVPVTLLTCCRLNVLSVDTLIVYIQKSFF